MPCYENKVAQRRPHGGIGFHDLPGDLGPVRLRCGKCVGCRSDRAAAWTIRNVHEMRLWPRSQFLTLTYSDENLPGDGSLYFPHLQDLLRKVRRRYVGLGESPVGTKPIRYFACGEYGPQTDRPHYHVLLYNYAFEDISFFKKDLWLSDRLAELWPHGHSSVGEITPGRAAYVSQYAVKKVYGRIASREYYGGRKPEFVAMSLRPGIGAWFYDRYKSDMLPGDFVVRDGVKYPVPRYYLEKWRNEKGEEEYAGILESREVEVLANIGEDSAVDRRAAGKVIAERKQLMKEEKRASSGEYLR